MLIPAEPNQRWSLDFVSDTLSDGRRFRILAVIDDCSRECLTLLVDTSISGARVARQLDQIIELRGKPRMIVSDNGSTVLAMPNSSSTLGGATTITTGLIPTLAA